MAPAADRALVAELDAAGAAAVPPDESVLVDGWLLRRTAGLSTKRANSVWPRAWTGSDVARTLAVVREFYAAAGLPPRFQLSPATAPEGLEALLVAGGFARLSPTEVRTCSLDALVAGVPAGSVGVESASGASAGSAVGGAASAVVEPAPGPRWWATWQAALALDPAKLPAVRAMLQRVRGEVAAVTVSLDGVPAGVGLGIAHGEWVGIFNMATLPEARGRGAGRAAIGAIAGWARARGLRWAYLQVEVGNDAAQALYRGAGFTRAYEYAYLTG